MKDMKRALRRHHRERMIARAMRSFKVVWLPQEERRQWALRFYDNLQRCSCPLCGHRRKYWGSSAYELRQTVTAVYEIKYWSTCLLWLERDCNTISDLATLVRT
jgi:hypothetical protein